MTELVDGIYQREGGMRCLVYIQDEKYGTTRNSITHSLVDLGDLSLWHRIADLDGKPVVDEGVIEALTINLQTAERHTLGRYLEERTVDQILKRHLSPTQSKQGEGAEESEAENASPGMVRHYKQAAKKIGELFAWCVQNLEKFPPRPGVEWIDDVKQRLESAKQSLEERDRLQARIAELEATPTTNRYRETATGDEWVFLPEDNTHCRQGLRLRDGYFDSWHVKNFASRFTPLDDAPIVRLPDDAFAVWNVEGRPRVAWQYPGGYVVLYDNGRVDRYSELCFNNTYTRTRPITLSPEQEATLVKLSPVISDMGEARKLMLEAV